MGERVGLYPDHIRIYQSGNVRQRFPVDKLDFGQERSDRLAPGIVAAERQYLALCAPWQLNAGVGELLLTIVSASNTEQSVSELAQFLTVV